MLAEEFLQVKTSQQNEAVVHRLLAGMCDAVVRLSHDFRIEDRAPHLMTLLSYRDSDEGLKGALFQDLMFDDSDKSAFCTHLSDAALSETGIQETASEDEMSIAGTLPSTLKDAGNNRVKVRLFYTTFKAMDNNWRYVVGICEDNLEEQGVQRVPAGGGHVSRYRAVESDAEADDVFVELPLAASTSFGNLSTLSSEASTLLDVSVWVKVYSSRLTVSQYSTGFANLSGPGQTCKEFLTWVCKDQPKKILDWVQTSVNAGVWAI